MRGTQLARRALLRLLKRFNPGSIKVCHHWTGDPLRMDCFVHRNYWYHGKRREHSLMRWFSRVIRPGDTVLELGGHIGYLTLYFASLVGKSGRVIVYEPGPNNIPYIRENVATKKNIELRERAVGNITGTLPMFIESISGMNNTFIKNFSLLHNNARYSGIRPDIQTVEIPIVRMDDELPSGAHIHLVKMDIEGFEYEALCGMHRMLMESRPILMVEVNAQHNDLVEKFLRQLGYTAYDVQGLAISKLSTDLFAETLWLHQKIHSDAIDRTTQKCKRQTKPPGDILRTGDNIVRQHQ